MRHGIAELVGLGLLHLGGAFADDRPLVPARSATPASRSKMLVSSRDWNRRNAFGVIWKPRLALLDALPLGHLAQVVVDLLLQGAELLEVARLDELGQLLHVDDADLGVLHRLFELLEELVDQSPAPA